MSATTTRPAWKRPGATTRPTLRAVERDGQVGLDRGARDLARRRVDARRAGRRRRRATPPALIRSITAAASGRGAPWNPVPKSASTTTSAPAGVVRLDGVAARLPQDPRCDAPVAAVRAAAADDGDAACRPGTSGAPRPRPPRPRAPSARPRSPGSRGTAPRPRASRRRSRAARASRPRAPRRAARRDRRRTTRPAIVCECVSETSMSRIPTRSAQRSVLPRA